MEIVNACLRIIEKCKPVWWAMENPRGYLRQLARQQEYIENLEELIEQSDELKEQYDILKMFA